MVTCLSAMPAHQLATSCDANCARLWYLLVCVWTGLFGGPFAARGRRGHFPRHCRSDALRYLLVALMALALAACGPVVETPTGALHLVPKPQSVTRTDGALTLGKRVRVTTPQGQSVPHAEQALERVLTRLGVQVDDNADARITLRLIDDPALGPEGYRLNVADGVILSANTDDGLLHAVM